MKLKKIRISEIKLFNKGNQTRWGFLIGITIVFTFILYPSLVAIRHSYNLGDVAKRDIKAPTDFLIEDAETTEAKRLQAMEEVKTVYDHDTILSSKLSVQVESAFDDLRAIFKVEEEKPFVDLSGETDADSTVAAEKKSSIHQQIQQMKGSFEEKINIPISKGAYRILEKEKFSTDISNLIIKILTEILDNGVAANKEFLLRQADKGIVLRDISTRKESTIYKLRPYYGLDQAKTMVRIIGEPLLRNMNYTLRNLIVDFVQLLIQPNITLNKSETFIQRYIRLYE